MSGEQGPRKTRTDRSVEIAGNLITSIADDDRQAGILLKRIDRQRINGRVLIVLAIIAAGALKQIHGNQWKDHVTDFPDNLDQEQS